MEAQASITIDYPEEILIEKGWMGYANCIVNNSGDVDLHNIVVSVEGSQNWFEFQKSTAPIIPAGNSTEFMNKIYVPNDTQADTYSFLLKVGSDEASATKNFKIIVFETRDDLLSYQVNKFRSELSDLEDQIKNIETSGRDVSFAKNLSSQIKTNLDLADEQIASKLYSNVTQNINNIEKLFIEANFDLSNPSDVEVANASLSSNYLILFVVLGVVLLAIPLTFLVRKTKISNRVRIPNLKIKELVVDNKKIKELEQEIQRTKESQSMIDGEYKDNVISKESYDELRLKYQQKLTELEGEIKKLRGY